MMQTALISGRRCYSSSAIAAKKWIYAKVFKGEPTQENFQLHTENLPALKDGGESNKNM